MTEESETQNSLRSQVVKDPVHWLAFGFGTGLLPKAPGTWASLATVIVYGLSPPFSLQTLLLVIVVMFAAGIWICGKSAERIGVHDHSGIVWDEFVGMLITLTVAGRDPLWMAVAFLAFRIMDIWKPWPIRDVDHRLSGGLGIMLDDVLAAIYAALVVLLMQRLTAVI